MPSLPEEAFETGAVRLPPHGSTTTAEDLRVQLVIASDRDGEIFVDGSQVESIGQGVLQLLLAARAEAEAHGQPFSIVDASPALIQRLTACRLAGDLGVNEQEEIFQ